MGVAPSHHSILISRSCGTGAVFSGYIADSRNEQGFAYMGKFCFDYTVGAQRNLPAGEVHIEIKIPMHGTLTE